MQARGRPGLKALFDCAGMDGPPRPYHLGFVIGPRINAGGRIGDAALGAKLLTLTDESEARRIAEDLDRLNRERQVLEAATLEAAEAEALGLLGLEEKGAAIVTGSSGWHPGIVGLVASRLKEKFRRPAFAIAFDGDTGTGSGRSISGVDLGRIVRAAVEAGLLIKGGGHAMAAGLTIKREQLADFRAFLETKLAADVSRARAGEALFVDATLTAASAEPGLMQALERAGPFGQGNPEPVFAFPAHRLIDVAPVGNGHIRLKVQAGDGAKIDGIAFRAAQEPLGRALEAARGQPVHLAGNLSLDRWGGRERVQLRVIDMAAATADTRS
jgi:single-stranded-DNA-specific exonuclease